MSLQPPTTSSKKGAFPVGKQSSPLSIRSLVYIALFAALFILLSTLSIKVSFSPVPFSFQPLAVMLAGLFLKPRNAFLSIAIVIILAAFGLPLFSGQGGIAYLLGPTGGFILAFPFCAMLVSLMINWLLPRTSSKNSLFGPPQRFHSAFILLFVWFSCNLFGSLLTYVTGLTWFMHVMSFEFPKALATFSPYMMMDIPKAVLAAVIALALLPYIRRFREAA